MSRPAERNWTGLAILVVSAALVIISVVMLFKAVRADPLPTHYSVDTTVECGYRDSMTVINGVYQVGWSGYACDTTFDTTYSFPLERSWVSYNESLEALAERKADCDSLVTNPIVPILVDTITINGRRYEIREVE